VPSPETGIAASPDGEGRVRHRSASTIRRSLPAGVDALDAAVAVSAAVLATVAVLVGGFSVTGLGPLDALWVAAGAVTVTGLSISATPWARVVLAGGVIALAVVSGSSAAAFLLVVWAGCEWGGPDLPALRAVGAATCLVVAVDVAPPSSVTGVATVLVGLVALPVVMTGWRGMEPAARRAMAALLRWPTMVLGGLVAVTLVFAVVGSLSLQDGVRSGGRALAALAEGDRDGSMQEFARASAAFDAADATFHAPWTVPARALPLVGRHLDAAATLAANGAEVAEGAEQIAALADVEQFRAAGGVIDVQRLRDLGPPLAETTAMLEHAAAELDALDLDALVPPARTVVASFTAAVEKAADQASLGSQVAGVGPALLGADGERRYLVLVTSPAEARELGGFVANVVEVDAIDGDLLLVRNNRASRLNDGAPRVLTEPASYPERFLRYQPERYWQNVSGVPDFPTAARAAADLFTQETGGRVDGVFATDPYGLAALLDLTGPIRLDGIEGMDGSMSSTELANYLVRDQYLVFDELADKEARVDVLARAADEVFRRLTSVSFPGPGRLGAVLGPVAGEGRLLAWSPLADEQALFDRLGVSGRFPVASGGDLVAVVHANANPSKIDAFLHRDVDIDVALDPGTGRVDTVVTVLLRNDAPPGGLSDYVIGSRSADRPPGTNRLLFSVYSPLDLTGTTIGGEPFAFERTVELGHNRYSAYVDVPPGGSTTVVVELTGTVAPGHRYALDLVGQPLVHPDRTTVTVSLPDGWEPASASEGLVVRPGGATARVDGPADRRFELISQQPDR